MLLTVSANAFRLRILTRIKGRGIKPYFMFFVFSLPTRARLERLMTLHCDVLIRKLDSPLTRNPVLATTLAGSESKNFEED